MISLCKDLIMKSLSFTFHAFLHGVQGQYCAWHPLQVLVGFVQTFSPFFNPKKCFSVMTVREMSDWVMWFTGHWLGRKGYLESVRAQRREETTSRSLEMILCSAFALWKAEHINHISRKKVLASHSSFNTVPRDLSLSCYYNADRP